MMAPKFYRVKCKLDFGQGDKIYSSVKSALTAAKQGLGGRFDEFVIEGWIEVEEVFLDDSLEVFVEGFDHGLDKNAFSGKDCLQCRA